MFIPLIAIVGINIIGFTAGGVAAGEQVSTVLELSLNHLTITMYRIDRSRHSVNSLWRSHRRCFLSSPVHRSDCDPGGTCHLSGGLGYL